MLAWTRATLSHTKGRSTPVPTPLLATEQLPTSISRVLFELQVLDAPPPHRTLPSTSPLTSRSCPELTNHRRSLAPRNGRVYPYLTTSFPRASRPAYCVAASSVREPAPLYCPRFQSYRYLQSRHFCGCCLETSPLPQLLSFLPPTNGSPLPRVPQGFLSKTVPTHGWLSHLPVPSRPIPSYRCQRHT